MSVTVYLDGRPAERFEAYREILEQLGALPDQSNDAFKVWTTQPLHCATQRSVWLNPPADSAQQQWLDDGGAILRSHTAPAEGTEDQLVQGDSHIRALCPVRAPIDPAILAAFLAHDFPLVDAVMLTRAYRGAGWPTDLSDYPLPVGGPRSDALFAAFPRNAGLYAVAPTSNWVQRLSHERVPVVQLRDKRADSALRAVEIRSAIAAVADTDCLLFINDDWRLAMDYCAYGVHLGQEDLEQADLAAMQQAGLRLGVSTHGVYEMLRAHACKPSYIALGAIYSTITKPMLNQPQGLHRLEHYVRLMGHHYPLVAIGGIDLLRIADIWATGVDCAAVLCAIVGAPDYRRAAAGLLATTPVQ